MQNTSDLLMPECTAGCVIIVHGFSTGMKAGQSAYARI